MKRAIACLALALAATTSGGCNGCASHSGEDAGGGGQVVADAGSVDTFQIPPGSIFELQDLPLERLCEVLNSGYYRYTYLFIFALYAALGGDIQGMVERCGGVIDERPLDMLNYSPDYLKVECLPDSPNFLVGVTARIATSVQAGRARYDGVAAMDCLRAGRSLINEHGGLMTMFSQNLDAGTADGAAIEMSCGTWLEGLVQAGGACDEHWECQPEHHCKRTPESCTGTCTTYVQLGQPCDALDRCAEAGTCVDGLCVAEEEVDGGGIDAGYGQAGEPCGYLEAGYVECGSGLYCTYDDVCQPLPGDGQPCTPSETCAEGLTCGPDGSGGGVCGPPRGAGADCTGYSAACAECHGCVAESSAADAPERCRPQRDLGESCGYGLGDCMMGYACVRGACRAGAAQGEACFVDDDDSALQGSCVAAGDFCRDPEGDGSGTCTLRAREGEACQAPPLPGTTVGSCTATYLYCPRASAAAREGTCARDPAEGQVCGDRYDLSPDCVGVDCIMGDDDVGTCRASTASQPGDPCSYDSDCPHGYYCPEASLTCQQAAALGQPCAETGYECAEGYCEYGGADAGYNYFCIPFLPLGSACDYEGDPSCGLQARCLEQADAGYACAPLSPLGGPCEWSEDCADGRTCQNGMCVQGICERDACGGCGDTDSLTVLLFFGMVLAGGTLRRRRDDES